MRYATLGQATQILDLFKKKRVSRSKAERFLGGLLSDLLDVDELPDRPAFRKALGLPPIYQVTHPGGLDLREMALAGIFIHRDIRTGHGEHVVMPAGRYDFELVPLHSTWTFAEASDLLRYKGLRPVHRGHLLILSAGLQGSPLSVSQIVYVKPGHFQKDRCDFGVLYEMGLNARGIFVDVVDLQLSPPQTEAPAFANTHLLGLRNFVLSDKR
jgi:hypothetical protein